MASNRKVGNNFEQDLCEILFGHGFWTNNLAQNQAGQTADVIAVRNRQSYLIDCKVCSTNKGFDLNRMEDNQDLSMTLWQECGNGEGWFAILLAGQIYMIPHTVIKAYSKLQSYLSPSEISLLGRSVEDWVALCR